MRPLVVVAAVVIAVTFVVVRGVLATVFTAVFAAAVFVLLVVRILFVFHTILLFKATRSKVQKGYSFTPSNGK